jgi:hypothetical protein
MHAPKKFLFSVPFQYNSPDFVRNFARKYGFELRTRSGTKDSEIWTLPDETHGGHWIIRIDSMGHNTTFHFGQRPHYHKNWVDNDHLLEKYLREYTPEAWVYADNGSLIGRAATEAEDFLHADKKAKLQHILR